MPYDYPPEPNEEIRERIQGLFSRMLNVCYPNCKYLPDQSSEKHLLNTHFFTEVTIEEENGERDIKDRVAAIVGGLDTDREELELFIDLRKWKASSSATNLAILIHELSHLNTRDHGWKFWLNFKQNFAALQNKWSQICIDSDTPSFQELRRECVHHVSEYNSDLQEDWWITRRGVADIVGYPQEQYETYELWSEPASDDALLGDGRRELNSHFEEFEDHSYIDTGLLRDEELANMELSPKYIERPETRPERVLQHIAQLCEAGFPLLQPPRVEPSEEGPYRIIEGEIEVAVAQRIGLLNVDVINHERERVSKSELLESESVHGEEFNRELNSG